MGLSQSTHGTWNTNALINLRLATGAICRPGSGPFSLTGQPNAMGGREMGYMGPGLPGQRSVLVDEERAFVEDLWGVEAGTLPGEGDRIEVGRCFTGSSPRTKVRPKSASYSSKIGPNSAKAMPSPPMKPRRGPGRAAARPCGRVLP